MNKLKLVLEELHDLDVSVESHHNDGVFDMAKINGHSIIWHKYAFTRPNEPTVEVYFAGADEPQGHVPIKGLRQKVSKKFEFEIDLERQVRARVVEILHNYPDQLPYVPEGLVDDLTKLALEMY